MTKFYCMECGAEKPVTKCCGNEEMLFRGSYLVCKYCGAIEYLPIHCGKIMKIKD